MTLPAYALFAAFLASAGVPIYIHAPKFFADGYGVSLGAIGAVLFALRLFDVVQDPVLGWLAGRIRARRAAALLAAGLMVLGMAGLFAVSPPFSPLVWMAMCLSVLFTAFSFLTILFYARGVAQAEAMGQGGHVRLAGWREAGALSGVTLFCLAPAALAALGLSDPFAGFVVIFAALGTLAALAMHGRWPGPVRVEADGFGALLRHGPVRRLLAVGFLNAAPVAVTSTLFLFFVESRLAAPELAGPLLVAFFAAAAASVPVWSRLAARIEPEAVLAGAMVLAIAAFVWAWGLETGDTLAFAAICVLSGAALGADMTILPAMMARCVSGMGGNPAQAFGLWNFAAKAALALAAVTVLPALDAAGYRSGTTNDPGALARLSLLYALVPCALKTMALGLLLMTREKAVRTC